VDEQIERIRRRAPGRRKDDEIFRTKDLAEEWSQIEDPEVKRGAFRAIRAYWQSKGWWEKPPPGRSTRQAKAIYDDYDPD